MSTSRFADAQLGPPQLLSSLSRHTRQRSNENHAHVRRRNPSLVSVGEHPPWVDGDYEGEDESRQIRAHARSASDEIIASDDDLSVPSDERLCSLTQMLFVYAEKVSENPSAATPRTSPYDALDDVIHVLELHFNTHADEKQRIYFEDIFRILHYFQEQITEALLIETLQTLQIDPFAPMNFETFIRVLCYLPRHKPHPNSLLDAFSELDHDQDSFITLNDIQLVLPHLTSHFDEEVLQAAIRTLDINGDHGRLSYFDFVTSLMALQDCSSTKRSDDTPRGI